MKTKTKRDELDDDFIGGLGSLSLSEEKALTSYFKQNKLSSKTNINAKMIKTVKQSKITV